MRLYSGSTTSLIEDSVHNRIAGKLGDSFFAHFRYTPSPSEVSSWRNSLRAMCQVFQNAGLKDHGVLLEYQLPQTSKRLDCMLTGRSKTRDEAVIVELKQWETCKEAFGDKVLTFVGGGNRNVLHPSAQVYQYQCFLQDGHTAFHEGPSPIGLSSCSYLHNYDPLPNDTLYAPRYEEVLRLAPTFTADAVAALSGFLAERLGSGGGQEVLLRVEQSQYKASKKLLEHVAGLLEGRPEYTLLDEQLIAFEAVLEAATNGHLDRKKTAIIIKGGPGTGKSLIALNLMARLSGMGLNSHYVTGSKAFTTTLREIVGRRASQQFKYFNGYPDAQRDDIDVMICDEAHRIRKTSNNRFTPAAKRSNKPQVEELFHATRVGVYFVDDRQVVKPDEIGSSVYIRDAAVAHGMEVVELELEAQFRCGGNAGFINWVNNTLDLERSANVLWNEAEDYEFRIAGSPEELERWIRDRAASGKSARLTAGFCWPWSDPSVDGTLVEDVRIGPYARAWNARPDAGRLAEDIPPAPLWAYAPKGIEQIGCVYTAQGFEFDYVGVIFGTDLVYRPGSRWIGQPKESRDSQVRNSKQLFEQLVKNTYRVLLTRGIKGCYVYFVDMETENFFRSRLENVAIG
jgi:uncharacterized protein